MKLQGKTALVTGATSGIGLATVERFVKEGAQVVFCGRREEKGREIESRLKAEGADVLFVRADCTIDDDADNLVKATVDAYGKIDILFNNAGILRHFAFENIDMKSEYDDVMNTNVRSYVYLCKLVLPYMLEAGSGNIINTASIGGLSGAAGLASYAISKGAVIQLSRSLAKEFASRGIRTNSISPGVIFTEMMPEDNEFTDMAISMIPMGRGGSADELAAAVLFLACDESSFVNGHNLIVDGGQHA